MTQDSDQEMADLMDGMADDLREKGAQPNYRRSRATTEGMGPNRSLFIGGAIVLVVLVVIFFFRGGKGISPDELKAIQGSLSQLDPRTRQANGEYPEGHRQNGYLSKESEKWNQPGRQKNQCPPKENSTVRRCLEDLEKALPHRTFRRQPFRYCQEVWFDG